MTFPEAKKAMLAAGEALDAAMKQVVGDGRICLMQNPELVDKMHRALDDVVAIVGMPWREAEGERRLKLAQETLAKLKTRKGRGK